MSAAHLVDRADDYVKRSKDALFNAVLTHLQVRVQQVACS